MKPWGGLAQDGNKEIFGNRKKIGAPFGSFANRLGGCEAGVLKLSYLHKGKPV